MENKAKDMVISLRKEICSYCKSAMPDDLFGMVIFKADNIPGSAIHYCSVKCYVSDPVEAKCNICNNNAYNDSPVTLPLEDENSEIEKNKIKLADMKRWKERICEVTYITRMGGIVMAKACCSNNCAVRTRVLMDKVKSHVYFPICKFCGNIGMKTEKETDAAIYTDMILKECSLCRKEEDKVVKTYYCNAECQKHNWPAHKKYH